ncbi:sugar ABC transporter permease [Marispirochaeta aestuarii]|uniref:carbohydrate ABC transporter permease n=1 Tax=Marispirochaeta aestuarii TaxID=1963862 RepID=UPI0029C95D9E|nr:sugar ABC transporter permease [Marispirochaeta aestuarii]
MTSKNSNMAAGFAFVAPALLIYLFYFMLPIPLSALYSLFKWDGISPMTDFRGFDNYIRLFGDSVFWLSFFNNIKLVILSLLIQLPMGLLLGLLVSSRLRGLEVYKLFYFVPMTISAVAIGITWKFIYEPNFGLLNTFLIKIGLENLALGWLGEPGLAVGSVIATISWQYIPLYMVIFAAALSGIPRELIEAAYIDGASGFQSFFNVTLPLLQGTIRTASILSITGSLKYFALIFVMTEGGPNHASELMATYMYKQAFTTFRMGYGSSIAVIMFILSFVVTILTLRLGKKSEDLRGT